MTTIVPFNTTLTQSQNQNYDNSQYQSNSTDQSHSYYGSGSLSSPNVALAQEPNPFEQSFGVPSKKQSPLESKPDLTSIDVPSYHAPVIEPNLINEITLNPIPYIQPQPVVNPSQCGPLHVMSCSGYPIRNQIGANPSQTAMSSPWINDGMPYGAFENSRKGIGGRKRKPTDGLDPKKILFLERNRQAALKCRLRKKKRLENTQFKRSVLEQQNMQLEIMANDLTIQRRQIKLLLQNHMDCPVFQKLTTPAYPSNSMPIQYHLPY